MQRLLIRADASPEIGAGHLMRCLAVAQEWIRQGGEVIFLSNCQIPELIDRLKGVGCRVQITNSSHPDGEDVRQLRILLNTFAPHWLIVDGYHFDNLFQKEVYEAKGRSTKSLFIDDFGSQEEYWADLILNQNLRYEDPLITNKYIQHSGQRLLLGPQYALLRQGFQKKGEKEIVPKAKKVLVTMGGADPLNQTNVVLGALNQIRSIHLEIQIIIGAANKRLAEVEQRVQQSPHQITLRNNVKEMEEVMAWADLAITAAGSTCWELSAMGVPMLLLVTANNQAVVADGLSRSGVACSLGWYAEIDPATIKRAVKRVLGGYELRLNMSKKGRDLVDGQGVGRVINAMMTKAQPV